MNNTSVSSPSAARPLAGTARAGSLRPWVEIAERTGPLDCLAGRDVIVLLDAENILLGARDLGHSVDLPGLAKCLCRAARRCVLHAFVSAEPRDVNAVSRQYSAAGWRPHVNRIKEIRTCRGVERRANSDNLILFSAGLLLSRGRANTVVVASGDGDLGTDLCTYIAALPRPCPRQVFTMSVAGSTSARLEAGGRNGNRIAGNLEVGMDLLLPLATQARRLTP